MQATQRALELLNQSTERNPQRGSPSDQHIVMPRIYCSRTTHDFSQPAPYAVALDGGPDLARYRKTDPRRSFVLSVTRLQHEGRSGRFGPARRGEEIRPMPQPVHFGAMALSLRR